MKPPIFGDAIGAARKLFDLAKSVGNHFNLLDIGDGFPGQNDNLHRGNVENAVE